MLSHAREKIDALIDLGATGRSKLGKREPRRVIIDWAPGLVSLVRVRHFYN